MTVTIMRNGYEGPTVLAWDNPPPGVAVVVSNTGNTSEIVEFDMRFDVDADAGGFSQYPIGVDVYRAGLESRPEEAVTDTIYITRGTTGSTTVGGSDPVQSSSRIPFPPYNVNSRNSRFSSSPLRNALNSR